MIMDKGNSVLKSLVIPRLDGVVEMAPVMVIRLLGANDIVDRGDLDDNEVDWGDLDDNDDDDDNDGTYGGGVRVGVLGLLPPPRDIHCWCWCDDNVLGDDDETDDDMVAVVFDTADDE